MRFSPPALLARHPCLSPHDPWLFVRPQRYGQGWQWLSWGVAARRARRLREQLLAADLPAVERRIAFAAMPQPEALLFDLAVQAAACISVPVASTVAPDELATRLRHHQAQVWAELDAQVVVRGGNADLEVDVHLHRLEATSRGPARRPPATDPSRSGSVVVSSDEATETLTADTLAGRVQELSERIPKAVQGRSIVVSYQSLERTSERLLLTWALVTGAAVVLEPHRDRLLETVFWVRPTVLHGPRQVLEELAWGLERLTGAKARRRTQRRALGRLRAFVLDETSLDRDVAAFWQRLGVLVVALPRG